MLPMTRQEPAIRNCLCECSSFAAFAPRGEETLAARVQQQAGMAEQFLALATAACRQQWKGEPGLMASAEGPVCREDPCIRVKCATLLP